ncbi:hypothetical protein NFX46_04320 [Streptomyces phaeoluteigriseus]|uniref:Uncharacterized protein n=1 Tax=Streptomyces phaeoluteigriseus TaxID=114686 RepID=A0ABY4Z322_9ACTN|nr:hypothetical protein [Streptomyces phaeoluteigriseus]USQ83070.1 hypothetical protein NFX46_04320 [Streptomyces phaeoluteigriseus]
MSRPAPLPAAALRLALRGVVLLGGLLALAFLFGGQAQAADGTKATTETATTETATAATATAATISTPVTSAAVPSTAVTSPVVPSTAAASPTNAVAASPQGASANPVTPVRERVVKPVGEVLEDLGEKLMGTRVTPVVTPVVLLPGVSELPTLPPLGSLPDLPDSPSLPSMPPLPPLPPLPSLPTLPVSQPGLTLPAPVASDPGQDSGTVEAAAPQSYGSRPQSSYGPRGVVSEASMGPVAHSGGSQRAGQAATGGHAPVRGTPAGVPDGALGSASLLDSGGSRHADAHAVTPYHRVPVLLVPGSAVGVDATGIRDRYRDIPVFPG